MCKDTENRFVEERERLVIKEYRLKWMLRRKRNCKTDVESDVLDPTLCFGNQSFRHVMCCRFASDWFGLLDGFETTVDIHVSYYALPGIHRLRKQPDVFQHLVEALQSGVVRRVCLFDVHVDINFGIGLFVVGQKELIERLVQGSHRSF